MDIPEGGMVTGTLVLMVLFTAFMFGAIFYQQAVRAKQNKISWALIAWFGYEIIAGILIVVGLNIALQLGFSSLGVMAVGATIWFVFTMLCGMRVDALTAKLLPITT